MISTIQLSSEEVDDLIAQPQAIMVNLKAQSTDDRGAIQASFPALNRAIVDRHLSKNASSDDIIRALKKMTQYLIGRRY